MKSVTMFSLAIVGTVALSLIACSRSPQEMTSKPKNQGVAETRVFTASAAAVTTDPDPAEQRALQEAAQLEQRADIRRKKIIEIRAAFGERHKSTKDDTWIGGIRGQERPQIFDEICEELDRFEGMSRGFLLLSGSYEPPITWENIGIKQEYAGRMYWETGIKTARLIIKMFNDVPRAKRRAARPCYEGKGSWNFVDERGLGGQLIEVLDAIHASASDAGMTSGELRQLLIQELKLHIEELREAVAGITDPEADSQKNVDHCLYILFLEAKTIWNITFDQLGIVPREYAMIKEKTAADAASTGSSGWCSEEVNLTLPH